MEQLTIVTLINELERLDQDREVHLGFGAPICHGSIGNDVSFMHKTNTTVGAMLEAAESAIGLRFEWRRGRYPTGGDTPVWLADHGQSGVQITGELLRAMTLNRLWPE